MATETVKQKPIWERVDDLSGKLAMLEALLVNTCGAARETFASMNENLHDWYLTHCANLAQECKLEAEAITEQGAAEVRKAHRKCLVAA